MSELMSFPLYVSDLFILLGLMNRSKLFCPSMSLIKSLSEVTPFCAIFGMIFWSYPYGMFEWAFLDIYVYIFVSF